MKPGTTGRRANSTGLGFLRRFRALAMVLEVPFLRRLIAFLLVYEIALVLLGGAIVLIGNGLIFAIMPLVAVLLARRARLSAGKLFERLSFSSVIRYMTLVSLTVGGGIWLLIEAGFKGQNFIWMALS